MSLMCEAPQYVWALVPGITNILWPVIKLRDANGKVRVLAISDRAV